MGRAGQWGGQWAVGRAVGRVRSNDLVALGNGKGKAREGIVVINDPQTFEISLKMKMIMKKSRIKEKFISLSSVKLLRFISFKRKLSLPVSITPVEIRQP